MPLSAHVSSQGALPIAADERPASESGDVPQNVVNGREAAVTGRKETVCLCPIGRSPLWGSPGKSVHGPTPSAHSSRPESCRSQLACPSQLLSLGRINAIAMILPANMTMPQIMKPVLKPLSGVVAASIALQQVSPPIGRFSRAIATMPHPLRHGKIASAFPIYVRTTSGAGSDRSVGSRRCNSACTTSVTPSVKGPSRDREARTAMRL